MTYGKLETFPILEKPELLGVPVSSAISGIDSSEIRVTEIDPTLSDTAAFCAYYEIPMERAANCVILEATRGDKTWYAAALVLADSRADVNGVIRRHLDARRVSFAPMDKAVQETGMEYGAITPIGLPSSWPILIDSRVANPRIRPENRPEPVAGDFRASNPIFRQGIPGGSAAKEIGNTQPEITANGPDESNPSILGMDSNWVIIGSGIRKSKIIVSGKILASLPNAFVLENMSK